VDAASTAPIEGRVLHEPVTGAGLFGAAGTVPVTVAAPAERSGVVSANPRSVDETVPWCGQAVEVSGRPVFVLHGSVPAYRDLTEGDSGADVRQLQAALRECGYRLTVDGVVGPGTAAAINKLYVDSGYHAVTDVAAALSAGQPPSPDTSSGVTAQPAAFTVASGVPPTSEPAPAPAPTPSVVAPRGELVFVPALPRITSVLPAGSYVSADPVMVLALEGDVFTMQLTGEQKAAVEAGQQLVVSRGDWAVTTSVPDLPVLPQYDDSGAPSFPVRVPLPGPPPAESNGQQGQFTIETGSGETYPTVVPVSAIYEDAAGQTYVLLAPTTREGGTDGQSPPAGRRVTIRVLESVQGYVAVKSDDEALQPGGEVVIGAR
jgi:peptidoglycan hydrolase-like protein with peptidoglycan-binding domain